MWYPDNVPRSNRLQQLVDSISNLQTDVINAGKEMASQDIREAIDELLEDRGMDSPDDIIDAAKAEMTPEQRAQFEALVNATKNEDTPFDWSYFAAGILMVPEGGILGAQGAIAAIRFVFRAQFIQKIAAFFEAAQAGEVEAATALADEIADTAAETAEVLEGAGEGEEIIEAISLMSRIGSLCKILGLVGVVVTAIAAIIEAYEEAKQKEELIANIQKLQPVRLNTAFLQEEITNIDQQLELIKEYVKFLKEDPKVAQDLGDDIVKNISAADSKIPLGALETQLEQQDQSSALYYGGDNLSHDQVVEIAEGEDNVDDEGDDDDDGNNKYEEEEKDEDEEELISWPEPKEEEESITYL